jgi:hypothetical protein
MRSRLYFTRGSNNMGGGLYNDLSAINELLETGISLEAVRNQARLPELNYWRRW